MAPTTPRPTQIDRLIAGLESHDALERDAAVARLRVLGARALPRLAAFIDAPGKPLHARTLALAALEGTPDPRAAEIALRALNEANASLVVAALDVLRGWVGRESGTRLLEAVAAIAVDRGREGRVRVAALDALSELPEHLVRPIREQAPPPESAGPRLDDPVAAREWVNAHGHAATLSTLHELVTVFRERERTESSARVGQDWRRARAAAHQALAARGSRLALYDLRETFSSAHTPLPAGFLEAVTRLGDPSCLEPLGQAWGAAPRGSAWRHQLADAAREIVRRARLTARHATIKKMRAHWEGLL